MHKERDETRNKDIIVSELDPVLHVYRYRV
jgi:hypothetical protein